MHTYPWSTVSFALRHICAVFLTFVVISSFHSDRAVADTLTTLATPTIFLSTANNINIGRFSAYLRDDSSTLSFEEAASSKNWKQSQATNLNFGFSDSAYWLATSIQATSSNTLWYLRIRYPLFDEIHAYLCPTNAALSSQNCKQTVMGDHLPFSERDIAHPEFNMKLDFINEAEHTLYLRIKTQGTYPFILHIEDEITLRDDLLINMALRGAYISMMLIMGLYNLFIFFSTRDRSYLYYSAFVISFMLFHITYAGSAFQFLWPNYPELNHFALPLIFSLNIITLTLFIPKFLNLKEHSKKSFYLFRGYLGFSILAFIMNLTMPYQPLMKMLNIMIMVFTISALIISARCWLNGVAAARFFTIAWIAFIIGLLLATSRSLGFGSLNIYTLNGYQIGSFIEIILLSLALGERITVLQKDKIKSKRALLESQEEAIHNLKKYEELYQNSITGQFQLNEKALFIKTNKSWLHLLNIQENALLNNSDYSFNNCFISPEDQAEFWQTVNIKGYVQSYIVSIRPFNDGEIIIANISMRKGKESQNAAWIGSVQNFTEKYKQEEAFKNLQNERNQSLRQLVMGVSHEMNTPLGNIAVAQSFLKAETDSQPEPIKTTLSEGLNIIEHGTDRLKELGQLMKATVVNTLHYERVELDIKKWAEAWKEHCTLNFPLAHPHVTLAANIPNSLSYPEALEQIFNHLFENSITHNKAQYDAEKLEVEMNISLENESLICEYKDNGIGIQEDNPQSIFQPFYTTKRQHAASKGLGLYQTHNLITEIMHGHVVWPENSAGFHILISIPYSVS